MPHIHFISDIGAPYGGSELLWTQAALRLIDRGHDVSASVSKQPKACQRPYEEDFRRAGIQVQHWEWPESLIRLGLRKIARDLKLPGWIARRLNLDWKIAPHADLVFVSCGCNRVHSDLIGALTGKYALVIQHVTEQHWPKDVELAERRKLFQNASQVFFISEENRSHVQAELSLAPESFQVVHNPCIVDKEVVFEWPKASHQRSVAFVGRLEPQTKGVDLLLRALAGPTWDDRDFRVNLYGGGASEQGLRDLAQFLNIEDRVRFCGHEQDVLRIWRDNELLVLPSRSEGLPLVIVEAMMCGRPVLTIDVAGNTQHLQDGVTGFVAEGPSLTSFARALERAWSAREQWPDMGLAAYHAIRERLPDDPIGDFCDELEDLL